MHNVTHSDVCISNKFKYLKNEARKPKTAKDVTLSF